MPISVKLRKESGLVVAQLDVPYDVPLNLEADRFPLLSGVDPYGDTVFNRRQMDLLLDEVAALIPGVTSEQQRMLKALSLMCERCRSAVHHYVWFVGD